MDSKKVINELVNNGANNVVKDVDSKRRLKSVYLRKYLNDKEKTKVKLFAKLNK